MSDFERFLMIITAVVFTLGSIAALYLLLRALGSSMLVALL